MRTRNELIADGKIWNVHHDDDLGHVLFVGTKTACLRWIREQGRWRQYRRGLIRLGKVIWEDR